MKLEERAQEKREELTNIVKDVIRNYDIRNKEEISSVIIDHFVDITPPENPEKELGIVRMDLVTIRQGWIDGGSSTKPGNIWLNWRKLLVEGIESILTIVGVVEVPWLIPLAALVIWNKVYSLVNIKIGERLAVVIWTIWKNRDKKNCIENDNLLDLVNKNLSKYNRPIMNEKDLEKMKCIKAKEENKWCLQERVQVTYK